MARTQSTGDTPDETPAEPAAEPEAPTAVVGDMNEAMAATEPDELRLNAYPPGSDELTAENVRRWPQLFTDEQIATIPTDELPETDFEKSQREAIEAAEAEAAGAE